MHEMMVTIQNGIRGHKATGMKDNTQSSTHTSEEIGPAIVVRATLLNILKQVSCGLYKNSGSGEMRLIM